MDNTFEEIRRQIHDIRNFIAPFDLKLAALDDRISQICRSLEAQMRDFELKLLGTSFRVDAHDVTLKELLDRLNWIETALKIPPRSARRSEWPLESDSPDASASA